MKALLPVGRTKLEAVVAAARQPRREPVGAIFQQIDGRLHALGGVGVNAGAAVQHAVDRGEADAGRSCDVLQRRSRHDFSLQTVAYRPSRQGKQFAPRTTLPAHPCGQTTLRQPTYQMSEHYAPERSELQSDCSGLVDQARGARQMRRQRIVLPTSPAGFRAIAERVAFRLKPLLARKPTALSSASESHEDRSGARPPCRLPPARFPHRDGRTRLSSSTRRDDRVTATARDASGGTAPTERSALVGDELTLVSRRARRRAAARRSLRRRRRAAGHPRACPAGRSRSRS